MVIFASEDIGLADPVALVIANEVFRAVETIGLPECGINLAHGATYLAQAKKSRASYDAYQDALRDALNHGSLPVPLLLRNAPTALLKNLEYGKGYEMYGKSTDELLPEKLKGTKYFRQES
jgi:putative ATPase